MTEISIGHLYTALHAGCASAVARVIEANSLYANYIDLSADEYDEALTKGEVDILVSAWFPEDNALLSAGREVVGCLYKPELSFAALKTEKNASLEGKERWDVKAFDRIILTSKGRDRLEKLCISHADIANLEREIVGEGALMGRLEEAKERGENPLIVAWQPHAIFHHPDLLMILPDKESLLGEPLSARIVIRAGLREEIDTDLLDELSGMMLGNVVMSALDYAITIEGIAPEDAAESWQRGRLLGR